MTGPLELQRQVCFSLYNATRAVTGFYRPLLEPLGLTYPQYLVLLVLWEHGQTSVKELGQALRLDSGTLSPLLKRLEKIGYVTRRRAADDERSVLVALTPRGDDLRAEAATVPATLAAASGLSTVDLVALRTTLVGLTDALTSTR